MVAARALRLAASHPDNRGQYLIDVGDAAAKEVAALEDMYAIRGDGDELGGALDPTWKRRLKRIWSSTRVRGVAGAVMSGSLPSPRRRARGFVRDPWRVSVQTRALALETCLGVSGRCPAVHECLPDTVGESLQMPVFHLVEVLCCGCALQSTEPLGDGSPVCGQYHNPCEFTQQ